MIRTHFKMAGLYYTKYEGTSNLLSYNDQDNAGNERRNTELE
jgi:hypothetical protein